MNKLTLTTLLLASLFSTGAQALNLRWLNYSPVRYYSEEDWSIYKSTAKEALDNQPDGKTLEWSNPKTGAHGKITLLKTVKAEDRLCRKVRFFNSIKGLSGESNFFFCKQEDGTWALTEPKKKQPKKP